MSDRATPQEIVAKAMQDDSIVKEWMFRPEVFDRLSSIAITAIAGMTDEQVDAAIERYGQAMKRVGSVGIDEYHKNISGTQYSTQDVCIADADNALIELKALITEHARGPVVTETCSTCKGSGHVVDDDGDDNHGTQYTCPICSGARRAALATPVAQEEG